MPSCSSVPCPMAVSRVNTCSQEEMYGDRVLVSPTMWHSHMSFHAGGMFPGEVPRSWLNDENLFICSLCNQLVSNARTSSHRQCCRSRANSMGPAAIPPNLPSLPSNQGLPSLKEVFQLRCPTLRFIPAKSRPAFAQVLSSTLRLVVSENSEEAWLKLFMLAPFF